MSRNRVDLPQPEGPSSVSNSPSRTTRSSRIERPRAAGINLCDTPERDEGITRITLWPQPDPYAVIDEGERIGPLVIEVGLDDAGLDHLVEEVLHACVGHRANAELSVSPKSTMPYSLSLAIEKAICSSVMSGLSFLISAFALALSP